ncbi:MAG TPA: (2Fe-2S)-binding protein [Chthonomonadales bacterium]|nr:(2Fe-2S)-binding protein [Chthonomonadales bacterium]
MAKVTQLHVNGKKVVLNVEAERSLLSVLRDDLDLTGAKYGCGEGQCGACTVLLDGEPIRSCITKVGAVGTGKITTIEGLERNGKLHPLQEAFLEVGAMQCGYCTGGMIMSGVALLRENPNPSREEIVRAMEGNLCRCGTYPRIIAAISKAARAGKEASK